MSLLDWLAPESCLICGKEGLLVCETCLPAPCWRLHESGVWYAWEFEAIRPLLHGLKYQGLRGVSRLLSSRLTPPASVELCVGVPTPTLRRWARGYSQGEVIASDLAAIWTCEAGPVLRANRRKTSVGVNREDRQLQADGHFTVLGVPQRPVWLIDDVVTTGATLRACELVLQQAGARVAGKLALAGVA